MRREVATGRRMNGSETFTHYLGRAPRRHLVRRAASFDRGFLLPVGALSLLLSFGDGIRTAVAAAGRLRRTHLGTLLQFGLTVHDDGFALGQAVLDQGQVFF